MGPGRGGGYCHLNHFQTCVRAFFFCFFFAFFLFLSFFFSSFFFFLFFIFILIISLFDSSSHISINLLHSLLAA